MPRRMPGAWSKNICLINGVRDWQQEAADMAAQFGLADRVDCLPMGDIVPVAQRARGIVTINSTSGTLGAAMGIPIIAPGHAVYAIPDNTHQGGSDIFWQTPATPDAETFNASCRILIERRLIPGGFFSKESLDRVVRHSIARFEGKQIPSE